MKLSSAGRRCGLGLSVLGLLFGVLGSSLAVTPVDGQGLARSSHRDGTRMVSVTAPGFLADADARVDWSEGCLRDPAGAERLRQLHLNSVRPLALALDTPLDQRSVPEWAVCQ